MSLEGTTGEMPQSHELKRSVEKAPIINKLQISRDFRDWVKFNSEPAEHQQFIVKIVSLRKYFII
jgi:hypothetical protein